MKIYICVMLSVCDPDPPRLSQVAFAYFGNAAIIPAINLCTYLKVTIKFAPYLLHLYNANYMYLLVLA